MKCTCDNITTVGNCGLIFSPGKSGLFLSIQNIDFFLCSIAICICNRRILSHLVLDQNTVSIIFRKIIEGNDLFVLIHCLSGKSLHCTSRCLCRTGTLHHRIGNSIYNYCTVSIFRIYNTYIGNFICIGKLQMKLCTKSLTGFTVSSFINPVLGHLQIDPSITMVGNTVGIHNIAGL